MSWKYAYSFLSIIIAWLYLLNNVFIEVWVEQSRNTNLNWDKTEEYFKILRRHRS